MATIGANVTEAPFGTVSKTYNLSDADMDGIVAAYQSDANAAINGTANRNQVLNYIFDTVLIDSLQAKTKAFRTVVTPGSEPIIT